MKDLFRIWLLVLLCNGQNAYADTSSLQQLYIISAAADKEQDVMPFVRVLPESNGAYDNKRLIGGAFDNLFVQQLPANNNKKESSFWIKLSLHSQLYGRTNWILQMEKRYGEVAAYITYANGMTEIQRSGWSLPLTERTVADPDVIFKMSIDEYEKVSVYLHVHTYLNWSPADNPVLKLIPEAEWNKAKLRSNSFLSVYAGFCLLAIFYWLITFIYSRRINYVFLIAATLSAMIFCLDIYGITAYLWGGPSWYPLVKYGEQMVWFPLMVASYFGIAYKTNPFREHFSRGVIIAYWSFCVATMALLILSPVFLSWHQARIVSLSAVLLSVVAGVVIINLLLFRKGHKDAAFGFLAILPILVGMSLYIFTALEVLPERFKVSAPIGAFSTVIMFFYGMVIYVRVLRAKRKKESVEKEHLIREQNTMLETEVANRTSELRVANSELATAIHDLKHAQEQLISAEKRKENEVIRGRISQDIHDDVSSELTRISWISELAKSNALKGEIKEMPSLLDKINSSSKETVAKLGEIIWAINPNSDTLENLLSYMRNYTGKYLSDTPIRYNVNFPDLSTDISLSPELKRNLFLILKEALHNALKYSKASVINVSLSLENGNYVLSIADDGIGMDENVIQGSGHGLHNMRRRMQQVHGNCNIESRQGEGTSITLSGAIY